MIYYDRIGPSEEIDVNKTSESKECDICHYWYFWNKELKFHPYVCNRCHNLVMMSMNVSDTAILNIRSAAYCCIVSGISKSEARTLMQNIGLTSSLSHIKLVNKF